MFEMLRSQAKIFYWIIAASFILFGVVFSYGGSLSGCDQSKPGARSESGVVGKINGQAISGPQFERMYSQVLAYTRNQSQGREMNANQYASAREQAWNQLLRQAVVDQAIEQYDIQVSDEELISRFENNPPPALLSNYRDQQTGVVNMEAYYADLQNPDNDWSGPEAYVRQIIQTDKLQDVISQGVSVSDDEVKKEYVTQTGRAVAEFVGVVYSKLSSEFKPSDEEINAYYQSHGDDYLRKEKAQTKVVSFPKEPSESDWNSALEEITEIRAEIENGNVTFEESAKRYSEDGSAAQGGDLGTFDRKRMVPEFTEAAFNLAVNEISQPVKTKFGYHLIEVTEQHLDQETQEVSQVTARHILLKVVPGNSTLAMIKESAQAFANRVDGSSFVTTAEAEALPLTSPAAFIEGRDIPGLPVSLQGSLWAHKASSGDVSPVFENNEKFYVLLAEDKIPAGPAPLSEVKSQVSLALKRENNKQLAAAKLGPVVGEIQMGRTMAEVASGTDLTHAVTDTFAYNGNVQDVGFGTDFNKLVIEGQVGQLIPEIETIRGLYAATPLWISPFDQVDFDSRREGIREVLLNRAKTEKVNEFIQAKLDEAQIEDFR